ncbi:MAG: hypothetical protein P0107_05690 [Nitrosomonas sp.]|nr:hypothetical protein [Nitrosomonas sp.]
MYQRNSCCVNFSRHAEILAQAYYDYLMARLRLKAEVGDLDENDLLEINALL